MARFLTIISYGESGIVYAVAGRRGVRQRAAGPRLLARLHSAALARRLGLLGAVRAVLSVSAGVL